MVAVLSKIFGTQNLELAEDVVQDALLSALETWKYRGIPDHPKAWLYRAAKNKAIDLIRKNKKSKNFDFSGPESDLLDSEKSFSYSMDMFWEEEHIQNDFLGMMFACCNPNISKENQVTFILKCLCGFSTKEVAHAFITNEETISKRIYRTKEYFRKNNTRPEIPPPENINSRIGSILSSIYLMFNEGYKSTHSEELIREELLSQSFYLCKCLLENKQTQLPEVFALMALMCFHSARSDGRTTTDGELILLSDQDRSKWNKELIVMGNQYLNKAAFGNVLSSYHLEAAIAYQHCIAKTFSSTNWRAILNYYDMLLSLSSDPVIILNRVSIILKLNGPQEALAAINQLSGNKSIEKYYLFHAVQGAIYQELGKNSEATDYYLSALSLTQSRHEKSLLEKKLASIEN
jgi:RNA polymerase sigma-70 factor (ECF subfamily)